MRNLWRVCNICGAVISGGRCIDHQDGAEAAVDQIGPQTVDTVDTVESRPGVDVVRMCADETMVDRVLASESISRDLCKIAVRVC